MSDIENKPAEGQGKNEEPKIVVDDNGLGKTDSMPGWTAGLSKEQKEAITSSGVKLPEKFTEFWNGHTQLEAKAKTSVVVPSKDAPKEQWDAYRKAMGIPESPDGYTFERPQLPEGMTYDESLETWFKKTAHELQIPAGAAKQLLTKFNELSINSYKGEAAKQQETAAQKAIVEQQAIQATTMRLKNEWGEHYSERLSDADRAFKSDAIIAPSLRQKIAEHGLNNDPDMIRVLDLIARATKSDSRLGLGLEAPEAAAVGGIDYGTAFKERYKR